MINFNTKDFNLDKIWKQFNIPEFECKYDYDIYGLKDDGKNPPILLELPYRFIDLDIKIVNLRKFLTRHGIQPIIDINLEQDDKISVGMRKDIRQHVTLSTATLSTIVLYLEGKFVLEKKSMGIPKFG